MSKSPRKVVKSKKIKILDFKEIKEEAEVYFSLKVDGEFVIAVLVYDSGSHRKRFVSIYDLSFVN